MNSIVVIGAGQAGLQLAESVRKAGFQGSLCLIDVDPEAIYQRPPLSKAYLAGELDMSRLRLKGEQFFSQQQIEFVTQRTVTRINRSEQTVVLDTGDSISYDRLVLATGARARLLPGLDAAAPHVHVVRSLADANRLKASLDTATHYAVLGGGFLGLECAATLSKLGKHVTVIEREARLLNRVCSLPISQCLDAIHRDHGVRILTNTALAATTLSASDQCVLELSDSQQLSVDELIVAVGVIPNVELAQACGLTVDNGIVTDANGQTSDPSIFAVGDCARFAHTLYNRSVRLESIDNAFEQARAIARYLLEAQPVTHKVPWFWSDQYAHKLLMAGVCEAPEEHIVRGDPASHELCVGAFVADRLVAVECLNRQKDFAHFRKLLNNNHFVSKEAFLQPLE
jgi:3-phenylpropionate/trans-cinnamate dioxygenase ferredoxin reductase component